MTSECNAKERKFFEPKIPHFFKIILQESVDEGRVEIPRKFVVKYGNDLPNQIFLQVPSGTVWKVDLGKSDGRVYMQNGWREFQQYYSIAHGTFLSFEYRSRSFFQVTVYDLSATEIVYPYDDEDDDDFKEPAHEREDKEARTGVSVENKSDPDVIILDDCLPSSSKRRKNSPLSSPRTPKMGRTGDASGYGSKSKLHESTSDKGCNEMSGVAAKSRNLKNLSRAAGSKLETPSFSVVMKRAYTSGNYVNININFARKYLQHDRCNVTLQNAEKTTWTVGYVLYSDHNLARLATGWSVFVQDNHLVPGTECVFELIDEDKPVLNVRITRASSGNRKSDKLTDTVHPRSPELQSEDSCKDRGNQQLSGNKRKLSNTTVSKKLIADEKNDALSRATASCQPENLYFRVVMQPTYIRMRLDVPFLFAVRHFQKDDRAIVLQNVDGRSCNVHCRINRKNRQAYLRSNWAAFVRDNNLKIGDVCTFELTKSSKLVMKVTIVRAGDSHPSVGSMDGSSARAVERNVSVNSKIELDLSRNSNGVEVKCDPDGESAGKQHREKSDRLLSERLSSSWIHEIVEAAEKFQSIHPCFKVTMKFYNLLKSVSVPAKFAKMLKLRPDNASILQLQVGEKRWVVKFLRCPTSNIWKLTLGWTEFSKDNSLKVGEICAFELIDRASLQVKVTIFRHNA